jgi:hypothetical protein
MTAPRVILVCALAFTACGGRSAETTPVALDAATLSDVSLFRQEFPGATPPRSFSGQCLPRSLPLGSDGIPNCLVVAARSIDPAGPGEIEACQRCSDPGFAPLTTTLPLEQIGEGLSNFNCLCAVTPVPRSAGCPPEGPTGWPSEDSAWCYADDGGPRVAEFCANSGDPALLGFSIAPVGVTTYVACFEAATNP